MYEAQISAGAWANWLDVRFIVEGPNAKAVAIGCMVTPSAEMPQQLKEKREELLDWLEAQAGRPMPVQLLRDIVAGQPFAPRRYEAEAPDAR